MNCYNGETYLQESINSVLSQTYKNWELIFWDNKSQDKSAEIFKGHEDKRFKYFYANFFGIPWSLFVLVGILSLAYRRFIKKPKYLGEETSYTSGLVDLQDAAS